MKRENYKNYVGNLFQVEIGIFLVSACTQGILPFLEEVRKKAIWIPLLSRDVEDGYHFYNTALK